MSDRRDARKLDDLLWLIRERLASGQGFRQDDDSATRSAAGGRSELR